MSAPPIGWVVAVEACRAVKVVAQKNLRGTRCVVIGAGVAGLSAALALAARGARVRVLERRGQAGGCLVPQRAGNFTFPTGEALVPLPGVFGQLFALANLRLTDFVTFRPVDPPLRVLFPDGERLDLYRDRQQLADEFSRFSAEDASNLARFLRECGDLAQRFESQHLAVPQRASRAGLHALLRPGAWPLWLHAADPFSLETCLRRRFRHPKVVQALGLAARRFGVGAPYTPALLRGLAGLEWSQKAWVCDGGSAALIAALLRACEERRIEVGLGCTVQRIEVENGETRRVTGEGFKPLRADLVISTATPRASAGLLSVLPEKAVKKLARIRRAERPSRSGLVIQLGTSKRWDLLECPETVFAEANAREMARQLDHWRVPAADPAIWVTNGTALDERAAPEGHGSYRFQIQQPAVTERFRWSPANTRAQRDLAVRKTERLGLDGLEAAIEEELVTTPTEFERDGQLPGGALYGAAMDGRAGILCRVANEFAGTRGLYFAGVWVHPGPGTGMAALSGMLAAERAAECHWPRTARGLNSTHT
ncbi:NAD(P)/FAD-dependent oxidoreductase [Candidatus Poribacteria bacterium]|nr:NAD(P)/FAD-dependent oxidoreductase [Candidatus Poribacteria bacterium]